MASFPFPAKLGKFPTTRMRRNRQTDWSRRLVGENTLTVNDLIWPIFVQDGENQLSTAVESMPGVSRLSIKLLEQAARQAVDHGIPAIAIFPVIDQKYKDEKGTEALNPDNLICRAIQAVSEQNLNLGIICDVALDPFTDHGHDGILRNGYVVNDETVEVLAQQALIQSAAGCTTIAPSDMMDGRVGAIRQTLDEENYTHIQILSYAAKYASAFYGPFRDAIGSMQNLGAGDKKTYQIDPLNTNESLREVALDISEGADMVMVKPGLPYLDIIYRVKQSFAIPTFAYQVSGEYSMIQAATATGWLEADSAALESLKCFKRAGADGVLTYFAPKIAELLGR
jgi:porphobilinogen synthase